MPETSETLKGSFTKFFGRQKSFDGNLWYPLLCIKFFDTPNFLKHWRDAHKIFRHCETKNFRRKNVKPPFSSIKLFETRNFLKNSRIPLRKFSALWDIKISTENRDMPSLIHKISSIPEIFWKQKGSFTKLFVSVLWDKKFRQNRDSPPSLCMKIFDKRIFLKHQSVLQWNISVQWDKNFDGKSWYSPPPPYPNFFDNGNYCNSKGFPYGNFRHCETKNFRRKILILPPPLLSINFIATGSFLKHSTEGFTYQIFRHCETKKIRQKIENRDITLWSIKFFDTWN